MAGARVTLKSIEDEISKSPLKPVTTKDGGKSFSDKKDMTIEGYDFTANIGGKKQCQLSNCQNVTIRRCKFRDKSTLGVALNIIGERTKNVIVEYCIFEDLTYSAGNGGEPLRIGESKFSGCNFECIVRKCIFRNLEADVETISIKSCGNTVEDCYFIDNDSNVTVRHGGKATIQYNSFQGMGGTRLHGYGNKVLNNSFKDNKEKGNRSPVNVYDGNVEKDPNWTDIKTPSGKVGDGHATYARVVANQILGNEFRNCYNKIFYDKSKSLSPKDLQLEGISTAGDEAIPLPPEQPIPLPPQPEPQPPQEVAEEPPKYARLCQVGHDAEATNRISYYVCADHVDDVVPEFQKAAANIKAKVKTGEIKLEEEVQ